MTRGSSRNPRHSRTSDTRAELARSVLARATDAHARWLHDGEPADPGARVAGIVLVRDDALPDERHLVVVEVADPAPVAVRERIRARVRLHGYAAADPERPGVLRLLVHGVELEVGGRVTWIAPEQLRSAPVDPIAHGEGAFLQHLVTAHADLLQHLAQRLPTSHRHTRVVPLAVDRHGLTLRAEDRAGHRDLRLDFPEPAATADDVRRGLVALAERPPTGLAALFRSGPAAARICDVSERP